MGIVQLRLKQGRTQDEEGADRHLHAVPIEVGMGNNGTQEPGYDLRQAFARPEPRHVCGRSALCGT